mmetsp:Transcript_1431/g.3010  ORF Transcript_1431/g.3010 Transcript_1431/m.3010 type:complete len:106 (+) Transcript_1431:1899-2216(+)
MQGLQICSWKRLSRYLMPGQNTKPRTVRELKMSRATFAVFANVAWTTKEKVATKTTQPFAYPAHTRSIGNAYVSGCITIPNAPFAGWISMYHRILIEFKLAIVKQ